MFGFFRKAPPVESPHPEDSQKVRIVICQFEDECPQNGAEALYRALQDYSLFEVFYEQDASPKPFLTLKQSDFFDLLEAGHRFLKKENADVLIWGYRVGSRIRLNFQKSDHYETPDLPFFSLLNGLYLPLSYFQEGQIPESALLLVIGSILALMRRDDLREKLDEVIDRISRTSTPAGLTTEDMPYVINLLLVMYLQAKSDNLKPEDIELIRTLLRKCFSLTDKRQNVLLYGCLYANAGQFFSLLSIGQEEQKMAHHHKAVESFRYARKFFNRYNYPYDFAFQSYQLSRQYFEFWKWTNDIQALRDAVMNLRDAEKIFTKIRFPDFWAEIQKDLGYYLSILGSNAKNDEVLMLAVEHYKKRQAVLTRERDPLKWAECEESVGSLLYTIGKMHDNAEYLAESIQNYASAADIYEELKLEAALRQMRVCQSKAEEYILHLQAK